MPYFNYPTTGSYIKAQKSKLFGLLLSINCEPKKAEANIRKGAQGFRIQNMTGHCL
jgi:hypothetical protein